MQVREAHLVAFAVGICGTAVTRRATQRAHPRGAHGGPPLARLVAAGRLVPWVLASLLDALVTQRIDDHLLFHALLVVHLPREKGGMSKGERR